MMEQIRMVEYRMVNPEDHLEEQFNILMNMRMK